MRHIFHGLEKINNFPLRPWDKSIWKTISLALPFSMLSLFTRSAYFLLHLHIPYHSKRLRIPRQEIRPVCDHCQSNGARMQRWSSRAHMNWLHDRSTTLHSCISLVWTYLNNSDRTSCPVSLHHHFRKLLFSSESLPFLSKIDELRETCNSSIQLWDCERSSKDLRDGS